MSQHVIERENAVLAADLAQLYSNRGSPLAQRSERLATRERLRASIAARERLIAADKEHVEMRETLNRSKSASRAQVIETLQQYEMQITAQVGEKGQLLENEAALVTLERKLEEIAAQFIADQSQKLADIERKADHIKEDLVKAAAKHERTKLNAPISGQVVIPDQPLMTIVPLGAPIEIEALIQNKDIGFVDEGQQAVVKVEGLSLHALWHGRWHRRKGQPRRG